MVGLSSEQVDRFIADGFVKLDNAFPRETADACASIIWRGLGLSPDHTGPWPQPVMRLTAPPAAPFREAAASSRLGGALDQLVGPGRWTMPGQLGAIVARFPSAEKPNDDGYLQSLRLRLAYPVSLLRILGIRFRFRPDSALRFGFAQR